MVYKEDFPFEQTNEDYFFTASEALRSGYKESQVWSVVEGEDGTFVYGPHYHYINVIGYITTEEHHDGNTYYEEQP
jgi:hypothetical protein